MPLQRAPRTRIQRMAVSRAEELRRSFAESVRVSRADAGLSMRAVADAAGISHATLHAIEHERADPSVEVMCRLCAVLGGKLVAFFKVGTGPLIHDHHQAAMVTALATERHGRWGIGLEVGVHDPVQGWIDAVLTDHWSPQLVATEAHSRLGRLEQQIRWATAKSEALAGHLADGSPARPVSRLLLVSSTPHNRAVAATHGELLRLAYPARHRDAIDSIRGTDPWPGHALVWCQIQGTQATLMDDPPRGIRLGR